MCAQAVRLRQVLPGRLIAANGVQRGSLLRVQSDCRDAVPRGIRMPSWIVQPDALPLRDQVPCRCPGCVQVRPALLLPQQWNDESNHLPDWLSLPGHRHVRADRMPSRHLGVVRGQGAVRQLYHWPLLPDGDADDPLPPWFLLSAGVVGADPVPVWLLLSARIQGAAAVPGWFLLPHSCIDPDSVCGGRLLPCRIDGANAMRGQLRLPLRRHRPCSV
mmetsp:Transcript_56694/g.118540  ORF Transcript_56694/g.118540 Transcript_56694/m.118540 type:complete len:217 (-) Transcript_56694:380-1030(-)